MAISLAALAGTVAAGQPAVPPASPAASAPAPPPGAPAVPTAAVPQSAVDLAVADAIVRVALVDLKINLTTAQRDYLLAGYLLRYAHNLAPQDLDILRLAVDAATQGGDDSAVLEYSRKVVALDPADTVAQLSLISARINLNQEAAERLALYDQFLGPKGQSIDPAIRSRLALDCAMLHRERGDVRGFVSRVTDATKLDPTNKEAASLAYSFFSSTLNEPTGRLELLTNLLGADPLDPQTHLAIARELAGGGAARGAQRFYRNAISLFKKTGDGVDTAIDGESRVQAWLVGGAEPLVKDLTEEISKPRLIATNARKRREERNMSTTDIPEPSSIRLPPDLQAVLLMAAASVGNTAVAEESLADLHATLDEYQAWIDKPADRPRAMTERRLADEIATWRPESVWLRLWAGIKVETVDGDLQKMRPKDDASDPIFSRLDAWLKLRTGDTAGAKAALAPLAAADPLAMAGLAVIAEAEGQTQSAIRAYSDVAARTTGTVAEAWARTRWGKLAGSLPPPPPGADRLESMAAGVPASFDDMIENPRGRMSVWADVAENELAPLQRARIAIRIRNTSPVTLGVGPGRPIDSRVLIAPTIDAGIKKVVEEAAPEVVSIDRRLRLAKGDELSVTVWAEPGYGSWAQSHLNLDLLRMRYRVLLGFTVNDRGTPDTGPLGTAIETSGATRSSTPMGRAQPDELAAALRSAKGMDLLYALQVAKVRFTSVGAVGGASAADVRPSAAALKERYPTSEPVVKAAMLAFLPPAPLAPELADFDQTVRTTPETDPMVIGLRLITRVNDPADPLLAELLKSTDATLKTAALLHSARLRDGALVYSKLTATRRKPPEPEPDEDNPDAGQAKPADPAKPGDPTKPGVPAKAPAAPGDKPSAPGGAATAPAKPPAVGPATPPVTSPPPSQTTPPVTPPPK